MLGRCPDDRELERMLIDNVVEEGTGEITGTDSHRGLYIRFANAFGYTKEELDQVEPLPETWAFWIGVNFSFTRDPGWSSMPVRAFVWRARRVSGWRELSMV
jgi:pyrroloquinoline quinone (PQQ) biosynthesis protein C